MTDYSNTLLAYLAPRFTNRTEDLAVEAIRYILLKSEVTRCALGCFALAVWSMSLSTPRSDAGIHEVKT